VRAVAYVKYDKASSAAAAIESMHEAVLNDGRGPMLKVLLAEAPNVRCWQGRPQQRHMQLVPLVKPSGQGPRRGARPQVLAGPDGSPMQHIEGAHLGVRTEPGRVLAQLDCLGRSFSKSELAGPKVWYTSAKACSGGVKGGQGGQGGCCIVMRGRCRE
jgi:hypothetical protein